MSLQVHGARLGISLGVLLLCAQQWLLAPAQATDISSVGSGNWTAGATWSSNPSVPGAGDNVTITAGHTVTMPDTTQRTVNNLTVNGTLTHALDMKIDLIVNGNLTVNAGGAIDAYAKSTATTSRGFRWGPGASHGGLGGGASSTPLTYGSITNPVTPGSMGNQGFYYGGGIVILNIAGQTTLNGLITADGYDYASSANDAAASGGSINLTTGTLTGSGTNSVNGGDMLYPAATQGGGGGRLAVKLTTGNSFDNVVMQAYGGLSGVGVHGGAGTIYLETASQRAFGPGNGTLIIDNRGTNTSSQAFVSTNVLGREAGAVCVRSAGQFALANDTEFRVRSGFTNDCQANNFGGTVLVDGSGTCAFGGTCLTNAFRDLLCTNANKQITFKAGNLYAVTNVLTLRGPDTNNPVVLRSATPGALWRLQIGISDHVVRYVDAQDSDARLGEAVQAADSVNTGNNSNWLFVTTGAANSWTGAADGNWTNAANWSLGHEPAGVEAARIPGALGTYPSLNADRILSQLLVENGASLNLNGRNLTVKEALCVSGAVTTVSAEILSLQGNADLTSGTISWGPGAVCRLTGTSNQTITADGDVFRQLTIENGSGTNTFTGSLTATGLTCQAAGATLVFQAGATYAVENLTLHGREASKITLRSSSPGTKWNLNVTGRARVAAVDVADADADGGQAIYPVMSINTGANNDNWVFGADVWKRWAGGSSTAWGTAGNWSPAGVPAITNRVWIDGNWVNAPAFSAASTVTQLVVGGSAAAMLTFDSTATLTVVNDVEVWSGATITHNVTDGTTAKYVTMAVGGNLTVDAGGAIDVSEKSGLTTGAGDSYTGGSYGGLGGSQGAYKTYGSITNPVHAGSWGRSNYGYGGGLAVLSVAGVTTLNGYLRADGKVSIANDHGAGSGGGINLTTATLTGSGTNSACGATNVQNAASGGGGGRIAVKLTAGNDFGNVVIRAHNGRDDYGGAGTMYLQTAAQGYGNGALIVDNGGQPTNNLTLISTNVIGAEVGSVVVRNYGRLFVDSGFTLRVRNAFTNDCQTNNFGGTVIVDGTGTCMFGGSAVTSLFANLTCTNANKQLTFKAGNLYAVTNILTLRGPDTNNPVVLRSATPGALWRLQTWINDHVVRYVDAQDSDARPGALIAAGDSKDSGNNSNWVFVVDQATNTWEGDVSANWSQTGNWSEGVLPTIYHVNIIPTGLGTYPQLSEDVVVSLLEVRSGASLNLNGYNLTVKTNLDVEGTLTVTSGKTLSLQGSADFTGGGTYSGAGSTLRFTGVGAQTLAADGDTFGQVTVENSTGPVTFNGSFSATGLTCQVGGATLTFKDGATYTVGTLTLYGREAAKITLNSMSPGTKWNLNVTGRARVAAVNATDSDADGGQTIYPVMSANGGNNDNWVFDTNAWKRWAGSTSTDFGTAGNWSPSGVPAATNRVWVDGNSTYAPVIGTALTVTQLVVGGSAAATLTFNSSNVLTVATDVEVRDGGTITHNVTDGTTPKYVTMSVGGNLTVDAGGVIDVSEKSGLTTGAGANYIGGSYGGLGGSQGAYKTYGSITNPVHAGSQSDGNYGYGGGLVLLSVAGQTVLNGHLRADGKVSVANDHGSGSGGGINLTTGTLTGAGTNSACGATNVVNQGTGGGGGRIAVKLTAGNDFGNVVVRAHNGGRCGGGAGTVYLQTAAQGYGNGALLVDNGGQPTNNVTMVWTNVTGATVGDVIVTNGARLTVSTNVTLTISGSLLNVSNIIWQTNSTCTFTGPNTATVMSSNTFFNLTCQTAGKTIKFAAGKKQVVDGVLTLNGPTLLSTTPTSAWFLNQVKAGGGYQSVLNTSAQDSDASSGQTIQAGTGSVDLGRNVNWTFPPPTGSMFMFR